MSNTAALRATRLRPSFRSCALSCALCLLALLSAVPAAAQSAWRATDGTTPATLAPGAPAGSYELSGFDNVNLFNGNLNFSLPLLSVGGRGPGYAIRLPLEVHWTEMHNPPQQFNCNQNGCQTIGQETIFPTPNGWKSTPSYGLGTLYGRSAVEDQQVIRDINGNIICTYYLTTLTRLTFVAPDGTEYELRDRQTDGQPLSQSCQTNPSRGKVFASKDGTAATFISDDPIYDGAPGNISPSGYLFTRDGARYRVSAGNVVWVRDRNGNTLTANFDGSNRLTSVADELGRQVTITYADSTRPYDEIAYSGFGGAARTVRIYYDSLANVLRPDFAIHTYHDLFPYLNGGSTSNTFNPSNVVSAVTLPDGRQYRFLYNSYGELARVDLPTGGRVEYDFISQVSTSLTDSVYHRLGERRAYTDAGTTLQGKTVYNLPSYDTTNQTTAVTVDHLTPGGTLLAREKHYFIGSPGTDPAFNNHPTTYTGWQLGREYKTEEIDTAGCTVQTCATVLRRVEQTWQRRAPVSWWSSSSGPEPANDPRLVTTLTTVEPQGADLVSKQTAIDPRDTTGQTVGFDQYNNPTDTWEYDFGAGAPPTYAVRHTHTDYLATGAVGGATYDYACDPASNCGPGASVAGVIHLRSLPAAQQVYSVNKDTGAETQVAQSTTAYDEPSLVAPNYTTPPSGWNDPGTPARGNATTSSRWLDTANVWLSTHAQYDQVGNVTMTQDADGHQTQVFFSDSFSDLNNGRNTYAFPTSTASAVPDPSGQYGSATALTTASVYDFSTGLVTRATDANLIVSNFDSTDPLDRPRQGVYAVGTAAQAQTTIAYDDTNRTITVTSDQNTYGDNLLKSQSVYDGLGRTVETRKYESATTYISSTTLYDALGRAYLVSRPSRGQGAMTDGWARTSFDSLGRVTEVATFAGAAQPPTTGPTASCANNASCTGSVTTSYSGNAVTVTDQMGRQRRSVSDALGRLVRVDEPDKSSGALDDAGGGPVQPTSYIYDALSDLTQVRQGGVLQNGVYTGGQTRGFTYDSLSRLSSATNPESGTVSYAYDAAGNLLVKTDARGVSAHCQYDALNRVARRWYNGSSSLTATINNSPALPAGVGASDEVRYFYDSQTQLPAGAPSSAIFDRGYAAGRLVATVYGGASSGTYVGYDASGRPVSSVQQTGGVNFPIGPITYNLAGAMTSERYPSVHTVSYSYDSAGRLGDSGTQPAFSGNLGDGAARTYASQVTYDQSGGMTQERFGTDTPLYHKLLYNSRAQLAEIRVGLYPVTDPTRGTSWERGAIINQYSSSGWGATSSGHDNNGNLREQDIFIPNIDGAGYDQGGNFGLATQSFSYDYLNRLSSASESSAASWTQNYTYDRYGNRALAPGTTYPQMPTDPTTGLPKDPARNPVIDPASNRIDATVQGQGGYAYDAAGNLLCDPGHQCVQGQSSPTPYYAYDGENRMTGAGGSPVTGGASYTYDGDGRRVRRNVGGAETWQVYGVGGELLAEYAANATPTSPQKEYGYRGAELLVVATPAPSAAAPSGLAATPTKSGTSVHVTLSWAATGAAYYRVERSADKGWAAPELVGTSQTNSLDDSGATQGRAYLYRVCAADAGNNCVSAYSDAAMGMAFAFADDPIVTASDHLSLPLTPIRAVHVTDLRAAINAVRALAGLAGAQWAVPDQNLPGAVVLAAHVQEMRDRLGEALAALGIPAPNYTDAGLGSAPSGTVVIQRAHFKDLRDAATSGKCGSGTGGAAASGVEWLVADQLGTPRMVIDHTVSLAGVRRHDYFPFGEEVLPDSSWRNAVHGYGVGDGIRQKFTGKERDNETGLDYFGARYYGSPIGRFTSADPLLSSADVQEPQSWNRYSYTLNNPLVYTDPLGLYVFDDRVTKTQRDQFNAALKKARTEYLQKIGKLYGTDSQKYKDTKRALNAYGDEGVNNGVTIMAQKNLGHDETGVEGVAGRKTAENPTGQNIHVIFDTNTFSADYLAASIAHEGSHVADGTEWVKSGFADSANPKLYDAEVKAFTIQSVVLQSINPNGANEAWMPYYKPSGKNPYLGIPVALWDSGWKEADRDTIRKSNIDYILSRPKRAGGYNLTPASKTPAFIRNSRLPR